MMDRRFLTVAEMVELRLMQFDAAVAKVRAILADTEYVNSTTTEYSEAWSNISEAADGLWDIKRVAVSVVEK
jgi:hypothetical protein